MFIYLAKENKRIKKQHELSGKKWLFESVNMQLGGIIHSFNFIMQIIIFGCDKTWAFWTQLAFSIGIVIFILLIYVSITVVNPKLKQKFSKENPEYELV